MWKLSTLRTLTSLILLVSLNTSCGIEFVVVLNPPQKGITESALYSFGVNITTANSEEQFRGVELYYHLYPQGAAVDDNLQSFDDVIGSDFFRLSSANDNGSDIKKPLFKVHEDNRPPPWPPYVPPPPPPPPPTTDPNPLATPDTVPAELTLRIDADTQPDGPENTTELTADPDVSVRAINLPPWTSAPADSFSVRRGVTDSSQVFKSFDEFVQTDADIQDLLGTGTHDDVLKIYTYTDVRMLVYAFAYGKEGLPTELHSQAVYLEYIDIDTLIAKESP